MRRTEATAARSAFLGILCDEKGKRLGASSGCYGFFMSKHDTKRTTDVCIILITVHQGFSASDYCHTNLSFEAECRNQELIFMADAYHVATNCALEL